MIHGCGLVTAALALSNTAAFVSTNSKNINRGSGAIPTLTGPLVSMKMPQEGGEDRSLSDASELQPVAVGSNRFEKYIDGKQFSVITAFGRVQIEAPYDDVLRFVKTIDNLDSYEPKLFCVQHTKEPDATDEKGFYISTGAFMFVPFRDTFSYVDRIDGFHSEMESGLLKGHMNGGFKVKPISDTVTEVYHYEVYEFNGWKRVLPKIKEAYLANAMKRELIDLAGQYNNLFFPRP